MNREGYSANLVDCELREQSLCFIVRHTRVHNHILSRLPVDGSCDPVLVAELQRIDDTDDFVEITARRCGVGDR